MRELRSLRIVRCVGWKPRLPLANHALRINDSVAQRDLRRHTTSCHGNSTVSGQTSLSDRTIIQDPFCLASKLITFAEQKRLMIMFVFVCLLFPKITQKLS